MKNKYKKVSSIADVTVYPVFCKAERGAIASVGSSVGLCEEDDGAIAFVSDDARRRYRKMVSNAAHHERLLSEDEKRLKKKLYAQRMGKK